MPQIDIKNIIQIIPNMEIGGAEKTVLEIGAYLKNTHYEPIVLTSGGGMIENLKEKKIKVLTRKIDQKNPYTIFTKIHYDDTKENYDVHDVQKYRNKYVKLIVVNKNDLYKFDKFTDRLLKADCHEVKIVEDFSDLDANTVSDDIVNNTEDTMTLLGKYIDELEVNLDKKKLKDTVSKLYHEAQDLEL